VDLTKLFENLKLDAWYKVLVYIGIILILSLFLPSQWITNKQLVLISSGVFLVGIGEWKNHKMTFWWETPYAIAKARIWKPDIVGVLLDCIGVLFIVIGLFDLI